MIQEKLPTLRLAMGQCNLLVGDIDGNVLKMEAQIAAAVAQQAEVIVFPELAITGYPPEDLLLKQELLQRAEQGLEALARSSNEIAVIVGHPWRDNDKLYNAASLLRDGRREATYFKHKLPNYAVFDEKRYFSAGSAACIVELNGLRVGLTVCEDIWAVAPAQKAAKAGAQFLVNLNASPYSINKRQQRVDAVRQRVRETGLSVVYVNQVGGQDELVFDGGSFALDKSGNLQVASATYTEQISIVEVDAQGGILPGEQTAQPEGLDQIYQALVLGTRDYIQKNGFQGAVLGLSGGIDSALVLAVAVDALGADQVSAVMMPSEYTADISQSDAADMASRLDVEYQVIAISTVFQSFLDLLAKPFTGLEADTTEENIQARCRGIILMALSNKTGRILLTTGNKSEMAVGYATLYGDMAGGYAPIKDIPKTLVYRLCEYRNTKSEVIPRRIIERPPSAELRPDQKDEDSLPPYDVLDGILEHYVELDQSIAQIVAAGYDPQTVREVVAMVDRNEYKRRQAPPGVRITRRAFGRDRRYPLTSGFRSRG